HARMSTSRILWCGAGIIALAVPLMVSASPSAEEAGSLGSIDLPIESMMSTYNFTDEANPQLATFINAAYEVDLVDGSPQGDFLTTAYSGSTVTSTIVPPDGWNLVSVDGDSGNGTYSVPAPGQVVTRSFEYTVAQGAQQKSNSGVFKIKKTGD